MEDKLKWFFMSVCILIILVNPISAANYDNAKSFDKNIGEYGKITVKNLFGLGSTVAELELKQNTNTCLYNCEATTEIYLANKGILIDNIKFINLNTNKQTSLTYDLYLKTGTKDKTIDDYSYVCDNTGEKELNGTDKKDCKRKKIGSHVEQEDIWTKYNMGDEVNSGTYKIKLTGKKGLYDTIDWQIQSNGVWTSEWAVWSAGLNNQLLAYYDMNENTGTIVHNKLSSQWYMNFTAPGQWDNGKIGYGINISSGGWIGNSTMGFNFNQNYTINFWLNFTTGTNPFMYKTASPLMKGLELDVSAGNYVLYVADGTTGYYTTVSSPATTKIWQMITLRVNGTRTSLWVNGVEAGSTTVAVPFATAQFAFSHTMASATTNELIDEVGVWNRSLTSSEITNLYNSGSGITWNDSFGNLNSPIDNYITLDPHIMFNCSAAITTGALANISLWSTYNNWAEPINVSIATGLTNESTFNNTINYGSYVWNCQFCNSTDCGFFVKNYSITVSNLYENNFTINLFTYETAYENFKLNMTYNSQLYSSPTASLYYAGSAYTGTNLGSGNNLYFDTSLDLPIGKSNYTIYWTIGLTNSSGTFYFNSSFKNQSVANVNLSICGAEGGNTKFLNISFKDESSRISLNATNDLTSFIYWLGSGTIYKTYTYQNTTHNNYNYLFCALPNRTLTTDLSFKYSNTNYPLRTFKYDNQQLSNATTEQILYMLSSLSGIYAAIRTADSAGSAISGVTVQYERQISGVWTLLGQEVTGDDGVATFWVDPNYQYRFTASKTGYITTQVIVQPSQTQYTLTMGATTSATFTSALQGIIYYAAPSSGSLTAKTNQKFNVTVLASLGNLENCKFELLASNNLTILASTTGITNSSYCFLSITYTTTKNSNLFGRLSIDTTNTTGFVVVNADWKWIVWDKQNATGGTFTSFFSDLKDLSDFGEGNEAEYNRIVLFFLITTILVGVFVFFSGVEIQNPGIAFLIIWGLTLFASAGGFFTYETGNSNIPNVFKQFGIFFVITLFSAGYWLSMIRRTGD